MVIIEKLLRKAATTKQVVTRYNHAAAIVHKGKILSVGVNQNKTHPIMSSFSRREEALNLHAELDAIQKALKLYPREQFKQFELYSLRLDSDGRLANAKPCQGCQGAIITFEIGSVWYTTSEGIWINAKTFTN